MYFNDYIPVFIQIILAFGLCIGILVASTFLGQRALGTVIKNAPYECGLLSKGKAHPRFSIKFYIAAMLFILFDIEVVFLLPWALVHREFVAFNISILGPILFFIAILGLGLWYELRKKILDSDI